MPASALRKRIAPSAALTLNLDADGGQKFVRNFRLSLDMNAIAEIEIRTGRSVLRGEIWKFINSDTLRIMLWAAVLANHPEYRTVDEKGEETSEGLEVIGSYLDAGNTTEVTEALWNSYLATLSEEKRAKLAAARAELEQAMEGKSEESDVPLESVPAPATPAVSDGSSSGPSLVTISASARANSASSPSAS